jgi:hypothetical protein
MIAAGHGEPSWLLSVRSTANEARRSGMRMPCQQPWVCMISNLYQPVQTSGQGSTHGTEMLVRWFSVQSHGEFQLPLADLF